MPKRTTVVLYDNVYEMLVQESIRRYGTARGFSRVLNDFLREKLDSMKELIQLIYSEKLARVSQVEVEETRKELSVGFVSR